MVLDTHPTGKISYGRTRLQGVATPMGQYSQTCTAGGEGLVLLCVCGRTAAKGLHASLSRDFAFQSAMPPQGFSDGMWLRLSGKGKLHKQRESGKLLCEVCIQD